MVAYPRLGKLVLVSPAKLVYKISHGNGFSGTHFADNHQLLAIGSVIPLDELSVREQELASFVSSHLLQIDMALALAAHFATA